MSETRSEKLDLRLTPSAKLTVEMAASTLHQTVSEFIVESALARAAEILPDRQRFGLDGTRWSAFQAALDAPVRPLPRLNRLLQSRVCLSPHRGNESRE